MMGIAVVAIWAVLLLPSLADAAICYVRDGGTATGTQGRDTNGGSWSQAYDQLSTAETNCPRGDTIYVADGTYNGVTLNTAVSGTARITIKKATVADHGTETGWDNTYGDGQASFGTFSVETGYWTINGQTRDESNPPYSWLTEAAYGFRIGNPTVEGNAIECRTFGSPAFDGLEVAYTWLEAYNQTITEGTPTLSAHAIHFYLGGGSGAYDGVHLHHNLATDGVNHFIMHDTNQALIEYNAFTAGQSTGDNHGESVNLYFTTTDSTVRYNYFKETYMAVGHAATAVITQCCNAATHYIYGNLFDSYQTGGADGFIGFGVNGANSGDCVNCYIVNNTIVHGRGGGVPYAYVSFPDGSGNRLQNNLFFDSGNAPGADLGTGGTISHNGYGGSSSDGTNAQTSIATSIFVDYAGDNYKLASGTTAGATLTNQTLGGRLQTFDTDMLGNTRGSDGTWDRGAFEYCTGGCGGGGSVGGSHPAGSPRMTPMLNLRRGN